MNRQGGIVVAPRYAGASPFFEGLAAVKLSRDLSANDWGYLDTRGEIAIAPRFKAAGPFSNGLAYVEWVTKERILLSGVIDRTGRVVVEKPHLPDLSQALFGSPSLEQLRRLRSFGFGERLVPTLETGAASWTGPDGKTLVPARRFITVGLFSEGRAPVQVESGSARGTSWGYADTAGALAVPPIHAQVSPFAEGLGLVRDSAGRRGWVTPSGDWAIPPMWLEDAQPFAGGRALVKLNGLWGYLDRTGRLAIPPRYIRAEAFSEGLAVTAVSVGRASKPGR
jgi:hypothetical protein